jgi:hypothetical protein
LTGLGTALAGRGGVAAVVFGDCGATLAGVGLSAAAEMTGFALVNGTICGSGALGRSAMAAAAASDTNASPPAATQRMGGLDGATAPGEVSVAMSALLLIESVCCGFGLSKLGSATHWTSTSGREAQ